MLFLPLVDVFGDAETVDCFSQASHVRAWLEVERALAAAQSEHGVIPTEAAAAIDAVARPEHVDLARLNERTLVVGYPILPLLEQLSGRSDEAARYLHWGATTQDIMDSGLALVCGRALDRIDVLTRAFGDGLARLADEHRGTVMPGRTHAQPAVPIALGGKLAVFVAELTRHVERLHAARRRAVVVQLFGAAGTAAALGETSRAVRRGVAERLGLGVVDVPWHIARDGLAEVGFVLAALAATCGKLAREVIELSRPEIGELAEVAGDHRGASSTMPQKANPIGSEAVVGMSILAAQHAGALLVALQGTHERAAGEWQAEWDALPLVFAAAGGALATAGHVVDGLRVFPKRMRENLERDGGSIMAEAAMMAVADVVGRGAAHALVYDASVLVRTKGVTLRAALDQTLEREVLAALPPLDSVLDPARYLGETDAIVTASLDGWEQVTRGDGAEAGTARP
jgi:3-carboxy-cis,cis-muconate cycloisomerase